jgi:hypothetical protein
MARWRGRTPGARSGGACPNFERPAVFVIALREIAYTILTCTTLIPGT